MLPNQDEILALAENIEEKGMEFYRRMVEKFSGNKEVANIFHKLAEDEIEHKNLFQSFRTEGKLQININSESYAYIKSIMQPNLFPDEGTFSPVTTPKQALAVGIEAEKTAILFYQELYNVMEDDINRKIISKLLKEEKMHLVELREYWDEL